MIWVSPAQALPPQSQPVAENALDEHVSAWQYSVSSQLSEPQEQVVPVLGFTLPVRSHIAVDSHEASSQDRVQQNSPMLHVFWPQLHATLCAFAVCPVLSHIGKDSHVKK